MSEINNRILVIDDEEVIRDTFLEILAKSDEQDTQGMDDAASALFDEPTPLDHKHDNILNYEVHLAKNGQEGYQMVEQAIAKNERYALIFCDMRMPGWDGLTTVQQIRKIEKQAEICFVTAYSDHSIDEIVEKAGRHVGYHCKPFAADEIRQIATKALLDYSKLRDLESLIQVTSELNVNVKELEALLKNILHQLVNLTDNRIGALFIIEHGQTDTIISIGNNPTEVETVLDGIANDGGFYNELQTSRYLYLPMNRYGVVILKEDGTDIEDDRIYLIRLFIQQASKAIDNLHLQEALTTQQRLSAMGEAASNIVADLRQPLGIISGALELIEMKKSEPDELEKHIEMLKEGTSQMKAFIDDILNFTDISEPDAVPLPIEPVLNDISEPIKELLSANDITFQMNIEDDCEVLIDKAQLNRAVNCMIENSMDALSSANEPTIQLHAHVEKDKCVIELSDNGSGIDNSLGNSIFEPFITAHGSEHRGLGLSVVDKIVRNNQGTISFVESDNGATFQMKFPIASGA